MSGERSDAAAWDRVAAGFTRVARSASPDDWPRPSPCEGWTARDIVTHLTEWVPPFLRSGAEVEISLTTSVENEPAAAWEELANSIAGRLGDEQLADSEFAHPMAGTHPLSVAIERFILGDVLIHTWDLAQAFGRDVELDLATVEAMLPGFEQMGDALAASGHFGAMVPVGRDVDAQTRLLALLGRTGVARN